MVEMARKEIRADVAGTVVSVLVKVGDVVAEGDELAFIEAMKMEIPVTAPFSGTIIEVRIAENAAISENDLSFIVEA
jgi:acetyl-CoA carboxylase biotin carboxyl carrier protein